MTWNDGLLATKVMGLLCWTAVVGWMWMMWMVSIIDAAKELETEPGLSVIIATGCSGGCWVGGLLPIVLLGLVLRR
ncbi:MAG: hypothetical protein ACI9K2_007196 [Myxococcota bacterium]|jgi:hypothetical protein